MSEPSDEFLTDLYQALTGHVTVDFTEFPPDVQASIRANVRAVLEKHEGRLVGSMDAPEFETTDRGFKHYTPVVTGYGHAVRIYESSAASEPHVWMAINGGLSAVGEKPGEAHVHMTFEQTDEVVVRLMACKANHYQVADQEP